jgi:hypothetical protein
LPPKAFLPPTLSLLASTVGAVCVQLLAVRRPRDWRAVAKVVCGIFIGAMAFAAIGGNKARLVAAEPEVSYRSDVWPILKRHCWSCHSGTDPQGGLKMDSVADMLKGGDSGPLYVAGKPEESRLLQVISGDKPSMPPKSPPLASLKVDLLRRWVAGGGKDDSGGSPLGLAAGPPAVAIPASYRFPAAISGVALSGDGKRLAVAVRSEVVFVETDDPAAPSRRVPTDCDLLTHVEFSPDGQMVAAAGGLPGRHGEVRFIRYADGGTVATRRSGNDTLFRGNFSPDGKLIALGGADGAVHLVPVDLAVEIRRFELHTDWVMDVSFAPDGKTFVSGGRDKATKISDGGTGALLRAVDASPDIITAVATDGVFAVSAGRARTLMGYDYKIALSGVGVTGAGNGAQPITKRDQYIKPFEGQPAEVLDIAASGDRKFVAVAGAFGEVRLYRIADRQRVAAIANVPAPIYSLALDQSGARLAVGAKGGQVFLYELPSGKLLRTIVPVPVQTAATSSVPSG